MLKTPYMEEFYTFHSKYVNNRLSLRAPQHESLEIFAKICDLLSLKKNADLEEELKVINKFCPTLTSFEREFPSVCFSLATGIGKTRLMGACIAYLRYEKGIKHFFVMAPNLTIYNKLKSDLGDNTSRKYVFKGLDLFATAPVIIDGDNYNAFCQGTLGFSDIVINVFNISKLNADSKGKDGKPARIKRLNEVLGESYFDYLKNLPDLCIFMDESHHYHADKSFEVINELSPILGVELTATPQVQKGAKIPFKNVVYEYTLAHALKDEKYVKVPVVFTRRDFRANEYTAEQLDREKLNDGLRLHEETKSYLELYARNHDKQLVKPFVLVVAKDTAHSATIMEYIKSSEFFNGFYKDKVMEINSALRGAEKDENIEKLLSLENKDNKIEIVIHVNMLKEGWDVTNLYTIIPLRASASETLTEQTIGRGLRLPYGERTGVDEVDRLSIVSHDKYEAIVNLANDPNSLVRRVYYIDENPLPQEVERETVELTSEYDEITNGDSFTEQLTLALETEAEKLGEKREREKTAEIAKFVARTASTAVIDLGKQIKTYDAVHDEKVKAFVKKLVVDTTIKEFPEANIKPAEIEAVVESAIETCVQILTDKVIPIPEAVVQPFVEVKHGFYDFHLDTSGMNWHPSDDTLLGTELKEDGKTFTVDSDKKALKQLDTVENEIIRFIIVHDNVDYMSCSDLLYSLVSEAKAHFLTYLTEEETKKVMRDRQKTIADIIYAQMNAHFYEEQLNYNSTEVRMRPYSKIETGFGGKFKADEIYDLRANIPSGEVKHKVFKGFKKACHTLYKFDSDTERKFAIILENDDSVARWMRPAAKQFDIYYGRGGNRYEPDFIVETDDVIYMVETKARNEMKSPDVLEKKRAGEKYCKSVSEWAVNNNAKVWEYALIPHDEVRINFSFKNIIMESKVIRQEEFDFKDS